MCCGPPRYCYAVAWSSNILCLQRNINSYVYVSPLRVALRRSAATKAAACVTPSINAAVNQWFTCMNQRFTAICAMHDTGSRVVSRGPQRSELLCGGRSSARGSLALVSEQSYENHPSLYILILQTALTPSIRIHSTRNTYIQSQYIATPSHMQDTWSLPRESQAL